MEHRELTNCHDCGDRWSTAYDKLEFPLPYGNFTEAEAKQISEKYKVEYRPAKKTFGDKSRNAEVVFTSIDQYARYMADDYGWTKPDCRIFYANGAILEINSDPSPK